MERCNGLGLVETIYEANHEEEREEGEENSASSFRVSAATSSACSFPSSTPDLQSIVDDWSKAVGYNPDVVIQVYGDSFLLHREPMAFRSRYIRQILRTTNEASVSPPLNITVETFTEVASFCYTGAVTLTPFNLAALTAAGEVLGGGGEGSLAQRTEEYFRREIARDEEKAEDVLWSCVGILPGSGEAAVGLAARCVQVLRTAGEHCGYGWTAKLVGIPADSLERIMRSMGSLSVHDHDVLYRIADEYFETNNGRLTEEEKLRICHTIDLTKLSHHLLMQLVQNSSFPLRFILKAMLHPPPPTTTTKTTTLSDLLDRDAAARPAPAGQTISFRFIHADAGENGPASAASPEKSGVGKRRGLGRKLVEGFRRLFRRDREGK
ncbi:BTB/POZ domain-containing protein At3g49900-like [Phalaenopsis equestris]|uniref:BTB/POZ domain-containing protein At3g49900-like n=1 Tax=Phalaenopsis equestris TaxID=78828 RepID=UPI0009E4EDA0|nr:BTB/POZ domain-containing protein At3g49900-like [Phalaenopsis equestris]